MSELTRDQKMEKIRSNVEVYLIKNAESCNVPITSLFNDEAKDHIVNIGTAIMANKLGIETYPGSFVRAILDNDLYEAINRADSVNRGAIAFYVTMMHNLGIPNLSE